MQKKLRHINNIDISYIFAVDSIFFESLWKTQKKTQFFLGKMQQKKFKCIWYTYTFIYKIYDIKKYISKTDYYIIHYIYTVRKKAKKKFRHKQINQKTNQMFESTQ